MRAEASTYLLAEERLCEAIRERDGVMQTVLEFDPPLPRSEQESRYSRPELCLICGDDRFETDAPRAAAFETGENREDRLAWLDTFFERPVCRKCGAASSARSERPLRLTCTPRQYDGAFGRLGSDGATYAEILWRSSWLCCAQKSGMGWSPVRWYKSQHPKVLRVARTRRAGVCRRCWSAGEWLALFRMRPVDVGLLA